ncbi:type IV secretory pathway, VirB9 component [Rhizobium leguminosarum bv. trifolii WSM2297]|uniref:Type IV secretory pathway, VirB9 component n=1 Tax=Rhizobium leguminosarum bv. trifolii WSM2297 TaxID=754762 RepID=J0CMJ3_RHILT|nr:TrbG/VirB9 family P-type conjugative transfer protein [Rhizobium leguminosarum]EJC80770.1 type IV secretory pathway, VirB9 component [Rhizobium leguminosarum bv. trifolii WSM2297]
MTARAALTLVCLISVAMGVRAEDTPTAGKLDPRMRYLVYNPDQVVRMSTAVGATLVVTFGTGETVTAVAVSNSKDLAALPRSNYLFFKASQALSPQPVIVLTTSEAGARRYVFSISTRTMNRLDTGQHDLYYSVQFVYPEDGAAARRKEIEKRSLLNRMRATAQAQQEAEDLLSQPAEVADQDSNNFHYVAKGDRSLTPLEVFDDGATTVFRFPGNMRVPSIYIINPDGKEAAANFSIKGDYITVSAVAREWRLRDGHTALGIFNSAYDPIGRNPGTGTVRADVWRVVKGASR